MNNKHSIYSPSGWDRWSQCPGSIRMCEGKPERRSSDADRGTMLHDLAEKSIDGQLISVEHLDPADLADLEAALQEANLLIQRMSLFGAPEIALEKQVSLEVYGMPEVFGTGDLSIFSPADGHLVMADYKFGYNIVPAKNNGQLRIYAGGQIARIEAMNPDWKVKSITNAVIQPQAPGVIDSEVITRAELMVWLNETCGPAFAATQDPNAPLVPGEKQCKYCLAQGDCPERNKDVTALVRTGAQAGVPERMSNVPDETLFELLESVTFVRHFCDSIEKEAVARLSDGVHNDKFMLGRGRSNRVWVDEEKADKWLGRRGIAVDKRRKSKLISPNQAGLILKKTDGMTKKLWNAFDKLFDKPQGKLTYLKRDSGAQEELPHEEVDALVTTGDSDGTKTE